MPEFAGYPEVFEVTKKEADGLRKGPKWISKELRLRHGVIPAGSRILQVATKQLWGGESGGNESSQSPGMEVKFGIAHSPQEFFKKSIAAYRPLEKEADVPDSLKRAIVRMLSLGKSCLKDMESRLRQWTKRAEALQEEEEEATVHRALDPAVEGIVKDKKIILFKEMLRFIGYPQKIQS